MQVALDINFYALTCWSCGISFAMPCQTEARRRDGGVPMLQPYLFAAGEPHAKQAPGVDK